MTIENPHENSYKANMNETTTMNDDILCMNSYETCLLYVESNHIWKNFQKSLNTILVEMVVKEM